MVKKMSYILAFSFFKHKWPITFCMDGVVSPQLVTKVAFNIAVNKMKEECEGAT